MSDHTKTPWTIKPYRSIDKRIEIPEPAVFADNDDVDQEEATANAEFIIEACNSYDALRASNERLQRELDEANFLMKELLDMHTKTMESVDWGKSFFSAEIIRGLNEVPVKVHAHLAKGTG
jgi:hypothetical protein